MDCELCALNQGLSAASLLWHDADAHAMFDKLPLDDVVFCNDGEVARGETEPALIEDGDESVGAVEADKVSIMAAGRSSVFISSPAP